MAAGCAPSARPGRWPRFGQMPARARPRIGDGAALRETPRLPRSRSARRRYWQGRRRSSCVSCGLLAETGNSTMQLCLRTALLAVFMSLPLLGAQAAPRDAKEKALVKHVTAGEQASIELLEQVVNVNSGTMNFAGV